jgi:hypothetical protein
MTTATELTQNEINMLQDIIDDQYSDGTLDSSPWSWSVCETKSRAAILGSLVKKGLMNCGDYEGKGRNRDQYCYLTDEGKQAVIDNKLKYISFDGNDVIRHNQEN